MLASCLLDGGELVWAWFANQRFWGAAVILTPFTWVSCLIALLVGDTSFYNSEMDHADTDCQSPDFWWHNGVQPN